MILISSRRRRRRRRAGDVAAAEVLESVAGNLRWGFGDDVVPGDAPPMSLLPVLVQPHQEQPAAINIE